MELQSGVKIRDLQVNLPDSEGVVHSLSTRPQINVSVEVVVRSFESLSARSKQMCQYALKDVLDQLCPVWPCRKFCAAQFKFSL